VDFGINANLVENGAIPQGSKKFAGQDRQKVNGPLGTVIESDRESVRTNDLKRFDAIDRMGHLDFVLVEWLDGQRPAAGLESQPVRQQFVVMQFRPGFHQSSLPPG
jgi:hypothetical protein